MTRRDDWGTSTEADAGHHARAHTTLEPYRPTASDLADQRCVCGQVVCSRDCPFWVDAPDVAVLARLQAGMRRWVA